MACPCTVCEPCWEPCAVIAQHTAPVSISRLEHSPEHRHHRFHTADLKREAQRQSPKPLDPLEVRKPVVDVELALLLRPGAFRSHGFSCEFSQGARLGLVLEPKLRINILYSLFE